MNKKLGTSLCSLLFACSAEQKVRDSVTPVAIDSCTDVIPITADVVLQEGFADENGMYLENRVGGDATGGLRVVYQLPSLSSYQEEPVTGVSFAVYATSMVCDVTANCSEDYSLSLRLFEVYSSWDPVAATWNTAPTYDENDPLSSVDVMHTESESSSLYSFAIYGSFEHLSLENGFLLRASYSQERTDENGKYVTLGTLDGEFAFLPSFLTIEYDCLK